MVKTIQTMFYPYCASSHVTIGERPILYNRVKKASTVKMNGAIRNSHSSRNCNNVCSALFKEYRVSIGDRQEHLLTSGLGTWIRVGMPNKCSPSLSVFSSRQSLLCLPNLRWAMSKVHFGDAWSIRSLRQSQQPLAQKPWWLQSVGLFPTVVIRARFLRDSFVRSLWGQSRIKGFDVKREKRRQ